MFDKTICKDNCGGDFCTRCRKVWDAAEKKLLSDLEKYCKEYDDRLRPVNGDGVNVGINVCDFVKWCINGKPANTYDDECACDDCGCTGNNSCGSECIDEKDLCALDENLICPCCNKIGTEENKKRWKKPI